MAQWGRPEAGGRRVSKLTMSTTLHSPTTLGPANRSINLPTVATGWRDAAVLALYAATLLVSATLLFMVQPMFARLVLPLLGGSPAVWNTTVVFYQAVL